MENRTSVAEFILLGFFTWPQTRLFFSLLFFVIFCVTLSGNVLIFTLIRLDPRLHIPMYFFLSNLAFVDICYPFTTLPHLLGDLLAHRKNISFTGCGVQMYMFLFLGLTECTLLAVMAYDRYMAICHPLRYTLLMNHRVCIILAAGSWACGFLLAMVHTVLTLHLPFCGPWEIEHFFCEIPAVLKLACADTRLNETVIFAACVFILLGPFSLILISYSLILATILRIRTAEGRRKAFSTCASHLTVVVLFYGSAIFMYMRPWSSRSPQQDQIASLFYSIITPMLNPMIYSLRNAEVKGALLKVLQRRRLPKAL